MIKKYLTLFLFLGIFSSVMGQNRVFDTISFIRGGQLWQIYVYTDSMQVNGKWFISFPGFGTTHNKAANGDHTHAPVPSPVNTYEIEAAADGANNWTVPFTLRSTTTIIYNSMPIGSSRWTGVGTTTLSVILDTRKNDKLVIIN